MNTIEFSKFNGQGNDFIIIDCIKNDCNISRELIAEMCNRNFGIGADGLILIKKSKIADFKMDYYNQDGSIAEMCGNGIRCMARFIYDKEFVKKDKLNIETLAGIKKISFNPSLAHEIKVDMGVPEFNPDKIPVKIDKKNLGADGIVKNYSLKINSREFLINCVSMGNPHCVIFLENDIDMAKIPIEKWGPEIETNLLFPKKTNVEFVKIKNKTELLMRVWERGVGETLACGTGACAAGVCSVVLEKIKSNKI
ncbi:MAG TPA: diaminopimelate epimerase, partial [Candidatus Lokiarchaeia archaeon]